MSHGKDFHVRLPEETNEWFEKYLESHAEGDNTSDRFRAFLEKLQTSEKQPKIFHPVKCDSLKRAITWFCAKCRKDHPQIYKKCTERKQ